MFSVGHAETELWRYALDVPAGGSGVRSVDLLAVRLATADGAVGHGFSYVIGGADALPLAALAVLLDRHVIGATVADPAAVWRSIDAAFNRTGGGPYRTALAAIDVAIWDLHATLAGVPLGVALGGTPRAVPAYGSGGFTALQSPADAAAVARAHVARGLRAVKPRVAGTSADEALLAAVASAVDVPLMVDANERCDRASATRLAHVAAAAGALFVEEPLPAGDVTGYRELARVAPVPLACGEHLRTLAAAEPFVHDRIVAVLQPDLQALGGLTPALALARLAAERGIAIAPHFLPGLFVHLAAAAPNVTWLEEFPLLEPLLTGLPQLRADGTYVPGAGVGHGLRADPERAGAVRAKSP